MVEEVTNKQLLIKKVAFEGGKLSVSESSLEAEGDFSGPVECSRQYDDHQRGSET